MAERTCSIPDCEKLARRRGWCPMHYTRWWRHGDPTRGRPTLEERFWPKVDRDGPHPSQPWKPLGTRCWIWTGATDNKGYGIVARVDGFAIRAHRWSYEYHVGPIPAGLVIDHLCRVRHCVNPGHMEVVTSRENTLRGDTIPARYAQRSACIRGHPYEGDNYRMDGNRRVCRLCHMIRVRRYRRQARR